MNPQSLIADPERRLLTAKSGINVLGQAVTAFSTHRLHRFGQMV